MEHEMAKFNSLDYLYRCRANSFFPWTTARLPESHRAYTFGTWWLVAGRNCPKAAATKNVFYFNLFLRCFGSLSFLFLPVLGYDREDEKHVQTERGK